MRLAIDVQPMLDDQKTGISWYTKILTDYLCEDPGFSVRLNYSGFREYRKRKALMDRYRDRGIEVRHSWLPVRVRRKLERTPLFPYSRLFGHGAETTLFFNYEIPGGVEGRTLVVVHDMAYKAYPETLEEATRLWLERVMSESCRRADQIITISEFSKSEIVRYLGAAPEKIAIVPCGVELERYHPDYEAAVIAASRERYGIPEEYYLYVGTLEPRKNIGHLIDAYARLKPDESRVPALVLGGKKGWLYEEIYEKVKRYGIEDHVIFTGYLAEEDVPPLMCGAGAFVFPSLYEGFGIPPLEAMACGTPVIASGASSLPEVVGNGGILVDPGDVGALESALKAVHEDEALQKRLIEEGLRQVRRFTWENSAEKLKAVCRRHV